MATLGIAKFDRWRRDRKLKGLQVAEMLGTSDANTSRILSGRQAPTLEQCGRIRDLTDGEVTLDDFLIEAPDDAAPAPEAA